MSAQHRLSQVASAAVVLLLASPGPTRGEQIAATVSDQGVLVHEGTRPVLFYQRASKSLDGRWPRAGYVHPLYGLDSQQLTEDFPADHRHHRGIFWAWHQLWVGESMLGDPWLCKDFVVDVTAVDLHRPDSQALRICVTAHWKSPQLTDESNQMIPVVDERTDITIYPTDNAMRRIDFDIAMRALVDDVRIGGSNDEKGYGGFSPRIKLNRDQQFRSRSGPIEPTRLAINAGPWIDIRDANQGIAILTHAQNPGAADQWILRRSHSMQNAVYPGRRPVPLSQSEDTRLRYRLIVHDGQLADERIEQSQADFNAAAN